jgi:tRNA (mo5U34)-methyltransferase
LTGKAPADLQRELDELRWYHTIDLAPGVTTKGMFDLRHALARIPFPDVRGKRCLDIGTWDGFYAYELERRGAAEVIAVDIPDLREIDYPPEVLADTTFDRSHTGAQRRAAGFDLLHDLLDSKVTWQGGNIYDLDPADIGTFDVVVAGSLLVHLRDPVRALDAVRKVTKGQFLSIDAIHTPLELRSRKAPLFQLRGETADFQWWLANDRGLRHLLHVGGFEVQDVSKMFLLRPGPTFLTGDRPKKASELAKWTANRRFTGDSTIRGHLHRAYLTSPRF